VNHTDISRRTFLGIGSENGSGVSNCSIMSDITNSEGAETLTHLEGLDVVYIALVVNFHGQVCVA